MVNTEEKAEKMGLVGDGAATAILDWTSLREGTFVGDCVITCYVYLPIMALAHPQPTLEVTYRDEMNDTQSGRFQLIMM